MVGRDVEHLEVGEVVLDLGALVRRRTRTGAKISAISRIPWMLGWSVPRAIGRPGRRDVDGLGDQPLGQRRAAQDRAPRSARAASIAVRTALATAPTRGRSSAGSAPIPRRTVGEPALLAQHVELERLERRRRPGRSAIGRQRLVAQRLEVAGQVGEVHVDPSLGGPGIRSPRASVTSRARRAVARCGRIADDQAPLASSTIRPNVAASRTARSARILRSISTSAFLRPWMNCP